MKLHVGRRPFLVAAVLGVAAVFAIALFVALEVRSAVAGPGADPAKPNPGHSYTEVELPVGTWTGLNADTLDGKHASQSGTNYVPYADASGNVGIGTTGPEKLLHITHYGGDPGVRLENTHTAGGELNGRTWDLLSGTAGYTGGYTNRFGIVDVQGNQVAFTIKPISEGGNVGIGTPNPNAKLQVTGGDAYVTTQGSGIILRATDGANCYRLTVNNAGTVSTALVTCP